MTRRLTVILVAVVAGALAVSLAGTALLLRVDARSQTERDLRRETTSVAQGLEELRLVRPNVRRSLQSALRLADLRIFPARQLTTEVPQGVSAQDIALARLRAGEVVSGRHGNLVYAAAGATVPPNFLVAVLTRNAGTGLGRTLPFVGLASLGALVVVGVVAVNLGRRVTRPLRAAQTATHRIAAGDLAVRVPAEGDDELADLSRSINAMAAALERSRRLERQFLLSVSHDLRTPLTSIRGYAEAVADGRAPDTAGAAEVILSEARRLDRLVGDLLELAKLEARRFSLDVRATDVDEVVIDTAEGFRPAAEAAGLEFAVETEGTSPAAADPDRLAQVVANLVENALKFAEAGIRIGTADGDGSVLVWVEDDGPGIPADELGRVFERFFQSPRQQTRPVGSGLGLAIVRELVEAMGGEVSAGAAHGAKGAKGESASRLEPGPERPQQRGSAARGCRMTVTLPRRA